MESSLALVTVKQAINKGFRIVWTGALIASAILFVFLVLLIYSFSWWELLLIPLAFGVSALYQGRMLAQWRIWAYEHVTDIHQFQRCAELARLLPFNAHEKISAYMTWGEVCKLKQLLERFEEDAGFIDDATIPTETSIGDRFGRQAGMKIGEEGIYIPSSGMLRWDEIHNDRIAQLTYTSDNVIGPQNSRGHKYFFRFEYLGNIIEMPFSSLSKQIWELDLLLYIYRGRFMASEITEK